MKIKFLILFIVLCLALCACGGTNPQETSGTQDPATEPEVTGEPISNDSSTIPSLVKPEVTEPQFEVTLPEGFSSVQLPDDVFDDDTEGVFSSTPVETSTEPSTDDSQETEGGEEETTSSSSAYYGPDILPEDIFE